MKNENPCENRTIFDRCFAQHRHGENLVKVVSAYGQSVKWTLNVSPGRISAGRDLVWKCAAQR